MQALYDAPTGGSPRHETSAARLRTAEEAATFLIPELSADRRLLDVGCGPGSITRGLAERLSLGEVVGIDLSRERSGPGHPRCGSPRHQHLHCSSLPFDGEQFDVVYAQQVVQHLPDPPEALRQIVRVLEARWTTRHTLILHRSSTKWRPREMAIGLANFFERHEGITIY